MSNTLSEITRLLKAWRDGDVEACDQVTPLIYNELRGIAQRQLRREKPDPILQPTVLVHELFVRLLEQKSAGWEDRLSFFGVAANIIRRILVDYARKRQSRKRIPEEVKISLDETLAIPAARDPGLVALDDALRDFEKQDSRASRIVELHIFGGLTFDEIAKHLNISRATVIRDWNAAKLWLKRQLKKE